MWHRMQLPRNEAAGQYSNMGIGLGMMAGVGGTVGGMVGGVVADAYDDLGPHTGKWDYLAADGSLLACVSDTRCR